MYISGIEKFSDANGDGFRTVVYVSGCSHRCKGCQNAKTWNPNIGMYFDEKLEEELFKSLCNDNVSGLTLTGGDPLHETNLDKILDIVTKFREYYPLPQDIENKQQDMVGNDNINHNILIDNQDEIRVSYPEKTIWLYTGYKVEEFYKGETILSPSARDLLLTEPDYVCVEESWKDEKRSKIISQCDVLIDGRYIDTQRDVSLKWRGSSNQRVINIQQSLKQNKIILHCD